MHGVIYIYQLVGSQEPKFWFEMLFTIGIECGNLFDHFVEKSSSASAKQKKGTFCL